jgi:hypothetical protein
MGKPDLSTVNLEFQKILKLVSALLGMTLSAFLLSVTLMSDSGAKKTFSGKMPCQGSHPESSAEKLGETATDPTMAFH